MKSSIRDLPAWGISLLINLAVLVVLHMIIYESVAARRITTIDSAFETLEDQELVFNETVNDQTGTDGDSTSMTPAAAVALRTGTTETTPQQVIEDTFVPNVPAFQTNMQFHEAPLMAPTEISGDTLNVTSEGVEGAMDRITFEIENSLRERQTLVIWVFDASQSLSDRRAAIADRFENVYAQLAARGAGDGLHTGVVSYGAQTRLMTPQPVTDVGEITEAVRTIQPDESGTENVFDGLSMVMNQWKTFHRHEGRWNKLVFIVTDERGDDAPEHLEEVINLAKRFSFRCYTVGNAAIFGQQKGYIVWTYPEDGFEEPIPIDQGPETAFPHVLQLPFWGGGDWRLNQMSAAFGPYALTRLCTETGGRYLITEDNARGYHFDSVVMREYRPDYRPVREIDIEISNHPAMAALRDASGAMYDDLVSVPTPTLLFFAENDTGLRQEITNAQRPMAVTEFWVNKIYDSLKQGERARDSLDDPRWRASFDLAMGRIMAMKVRLVGYNQMLANMKNSPRSFEENGNNEWRLVSSSLIDTGPQMRNAAEEAREYLKRVIDEHPGTPWEKLAVRELGQDMGWEWQESMRYVPGMENDTSIDPERLRILLAEEMRRQQRQQMQAVQRDRPNL